MSDRGDSTRDWLLKKLLKAKESLVEQSQELKAVGQKLEASTSREQDIETRLFRERQEGGVLIRDLHNRIRDMAPERQFRVVFRGAAGTAIPLHITSVSSANGETVIHVER